MWEWRYPVRTFSTGICRLNKSGNVPISINSPLSTPMSVGRIFTEDQVNLSYQENEIIKYLLSITPKDKKVSISKFPYREMADRPWSAYLPQVPSGLNPENLNQYVEQLTSYRYHSSVTKVIEDSLMGIVNAAPEMLTKKSYLDIIGHLHFMLQDHLCFQVLETMTKKTHIQQDIDFANMLISYANCITDYRPRIKRLEKLSDHNVEANTNTWYYIFRMFRRIDPKLQLLTLMNEYGISHKPILYSAIHYLSKSLTAEQLLDYYKKEGINTQELTPYLFNRLISAYLHNSRVNEAWVLTQEQHKKTSTTVNRGTFAEFNKYFAERGEFYNCIAFSDLFSKTFGLKTRHIMAHELLEAELPHCQFFDNWFLFVEVLVNILKNESRNRTFMNRQMTNHLIGYARLHGRQNFNPMTFESNGLIFRNRLFGNLVWSNESCTYGLPVNLKENSTKFQEAASLISNVKNELKNPSDFL